MVIVNHRTREKVATIYVVIVLYDLVVTFSLKRNPNVDRKNYNGVRDFKGLFC